MEPAGDLLPLLQRAWASRNQEEGALAVWGGQLTSQQGVPAGALCPAPPPLHSLLGVTHSGHPHHAAPVVRVSRGQAAPHLLECLLLICTPILR